ncbi:UNVERIFIED_CONTAM: hypothetical protein Sindi_2419800 [Sesamum indicum]
MENTKVYLRRHIVTKGLGRPRYFLGIEIAHNKHGILYLKENMPVITDLLQEKGLLCAKPMGSDPDFWNDDDVALRILKYLKSSLGILRLGETRNRQQLLDAVVPYRAMAHTASEVLWLKNLRRELGFAYNDLVPMYCDN